jgi:uncharacterized protein involved in exopolysaccharide biosynthesis
MTEYGHPTYGAADAGTSGRGRRLSDNGAGVSNIVLSEIPKAFIRQLPWMAVLFVILLILSVWFTKDIKRQYHADGKILVQLGSEYVYDPASGNTNSGLTITPDQIVLTEVDIIKNSEILDYVTNVMISSPANGGVGGERFAPRLYEKWVRANPADKVDRWNDILKQVDKSYAVIPKPKSFNVDLIYKHEDGEVAVKTLRAFMSRYRTFRKEKFISEESGQVSERRRATEEQLQGVENKIQRVLNKNGISEFDTEKNGVQKRAEDLKTELSRLQGQLSAAEAALAASEDQLRVTPQTVDLYVDDRGAQRLAQAQLERRQLLAKYLPTSNPVRAKEAEIAQLQAQSNTNGGRPLGGRRVGQNTVYQSLMTQRNTFQAQADGLREQEITLQNLLKSTVRKVKTMRQLDPQYRSLEREKASLEERLKGLNAKEQIALVNQQQQEDSSENIKVITTPSVPRKGRNMRKILLVLAIMGSLFTVVMLGLLRVFLDPKIYGGGSSGQKTSISGPVPYGTNSYPGPNSIPDPVPDYAAVGQNTSTYGVPAYNAAGYETISEPDYYGEHTNSNISSHANVEPYMANNPPGTVHSDDAYVGFDYNDRMDAHAVDGANAPNGMLGAELAPVQMQPASAAVPGEPQPYVSAPQVAPPMAQAYTPVAEQTSPQIYAGQSSDIPVLGGGNSANPYGQS